MKRLQKLLLPALLLAFSQAASAALNVLACEPEWGALARELGGDQVSVYDATSALQDPHHIEAKPSLIARARKADLLVCTGADLEVGWLPLLQRQAGNAKIQPGKPGYFEAAAYVRMLEIPTRVDRAEGDIHPGGNPHIHLDPRNISMVSEALARQLAEIDPNHAPFYAERQQKFAKRWHQAIAAWETKAAPLKGIAIVVQHRSFPYLAHWLDLKQVAALEPKPGIEPTSAHLTAILAQLKQTPARMVLRAAYQHDRPSRWINERTGIPAVVLPFTVGGSEQAKDLFGLFDDTLNRLLDALK
jgi:zinc/manganese transport system substrate-binding protein